MQPSAPPQQINALAGTYTVLVTAQSPGIQQERQSRNCGPVRKPIVSSEVHDQVAGEDQLAVLRALVVCGRIVGVLVTEFRPEQHRGTDPVAPAD